MSKQTETTLHVQTEILRKKLITHLNRFDYSQLHFCVQNFLSEIYCLKKDFKEVNNFLNMNIVISRTNFFGSFSRETTLGDIWLYLGSDLPF